MDALGSGHYGLWNWNPLPGKPNSRRPRRQRRFDYKSESNGSAESAGGSGFRFPFQQAVAAGSLAFTGDTIAQLTQRWRKAEAIKKRSVLDSGGAGQDELWNHLLDHDWLRALRMTSYGFLLYGPGSYAWYEYLDHILPKPTVKNIMLKVLLNQVILGPSVIAVIFAWNNLWLGKLSELPEKYRKDAFCTLLYGFRFWIPVSALNFCSHSLAMRMASEQGGASSSSSSFHVYGLNILEFLLVHNNEQVKCVEEFLQQLELSENFNMRLAHGLTDAGEDSCVEQNRQ